MSKKSDELAHANERVKALILSQDKFVETYAAELMKEDGRAHIEVDLRHGAEVYDAFSSGHDLSPALFSYVESSVKYLRVSTPISIDFLVDPSKTMDQEKISKEFKGNYRFDFDETRHEIFRCNHSIIWLYLVGVLLIVLTSLFTGFYHKFTAEGIYGAEYFDIASQILSIASWVFIWDAVDKQAFEKRDLKKKLLRDAQLCDPNISFLASDTSGEVIS